MKKVIVLLSIAASCTATWFPLFPYSQASTQPEAYNVCVYSKDPAQYSPNCFVCPQVVYSNALQACVNGTTMPSNISYSSATCMEKNCGINYPQVSTSAPVQGSDFFDSLSKLLRLSRSIDDNQVDNTEQMPMVQTGPPKSGWKIVAEIETFASDLGGPVDFDYFI